MYVVVYWLHGFNPFLICLFVLHTAIMLSANREHTHFVQNSLRNTLQLLNKERALRHTLSFIWQHQGGEKNLENKLKLKMIRKRSLEGYVWKIELENNVH